jgi:hypothetical protein
MGCTLDHDQDSPLAHLSLGGGRAPGPQHGLKVARPVVQLLPCCLCLRPGGRVVPDQLLYHLTKIHINKYIAKSLKIQKKTLKNVTFRDKTKKSKKTLGKCHFLLTKLKKSKKKHFGIQNKKKSKKKHHSPVNLCKK